MVRKTRYKILPYDTGRFSWDGTGEYLHWWYFDAEFSSGHRIMTISMPRMVGDVNDDENGPVPGATLVVMEPGYANHHSHAYYPGEFTGDAEAMEASFGDDFIKQADGKYHVRFKQGDLGLDLTYAPAYPPWPPFPGRDGYMARPVLWTLAPGKYFQYASMVPRGNVEGTLFLPGGQTAVRGDGYHEFGRTNASINGLFTYWYWTRFYLGDWTFIFPVAESPRRTLNAKMRALLVYHGEECVADLFDFTGLYLDYDVTEYRAHEATGRVDIPRRAVFTARWRGLRLRVEMDLFHELESFRYKPFGDGTESQPAWFQYVMRVKADMRWKGQPVELEGEGIFEAMITGSR